MSHLGWTFPSGSDHYRLNVLGSGSCFFHSLLTSTEPEYNKQDDLAKSLLSQQLRKELATSLTIQDFLNASCNGTPLYKDLPQSISPYRRNNYTMDPQEVQKLTVELETLKDKLPPDQGSFLIDFLAFKEYIANPGQDVGDEVHLLASRVLEVDIYITTGVTAGEPGYMLHDPSLTLKGLESVILFNSGGHWEPVARVKDNITTLLFQADDPLILHLKAYNEECWRRISCSQPSGLIAPPETDTA